MFCILVIIQPRFFHVRGYDVKMGVAQKNSRAQVFNNLSTPLPSILDPPLCSKRVINLINVDMSALLAIIQPTYVYSSVWLGSGLTGRRILGGAYLGNNTACASVRSQREIATACVNL